MTPFLCAIIRSSADIALNRYLVRKFFIILCKVGEIVVVVEVSRRCRSGMSQQTRCAGGSGSSTHRRSSLDDTRLEAALCCRIQHTAPRNIAIRSSWLVFTVLKVYIRHARRLFYANAVRHAVVLEDVKSRCRPRHWSFPYSHTATRSTPTDGFLTSIKDTEAKSSTCWPRAQRSLWASQPLHSSMTPTVTW